MYYKPNVSLAKMYSWYRFVWRYADNWIKYVWTAKRIIIGLWRI